MEMRFESLQVRLNVEYIIRTMVNEQKSFDLDLFDEPLWDDEWDIKECEFNPVYQDIV